jgi:Bacteriophage CI repressor helix-turn-helix domain
MSTAELPFDHGASSEESDADDLVWAKNQIELADHLGVSRESIGRWMKQDGCPGHKADGRYNIQKWRTWMEASGKGSKKKPPKTKLDHEIERLQLDNARRRMEQDVARGKLINEDEVIGVLTQLFQGLVNELRTIKHDIAPSVVGESVPEATNRIGRRVDEALEKLSLADWAKKKAFWRSVSQKLCDLLVGNRLSTGLVSTSS